MLGCGSNGLFASESNLVGFRSASDIYRRPDLASFQLFTNGQRQFAQKVDTGSDPETIFYSFRLRNPDVAGNRPVIEPILLASKKWWQIVSP